MKIFFYNKVHSFSSLQLRQKIATSVLFLLLFVGNIQAQSYNIDDFNTVTTCSGTLYDSGAGGNYTSSENESITICPDDPSTQRIRLNGSYNTESSYDEITVENSCGTVLVNEVSGTGSINVVSSAADGCLMVTFTSDGSVVRPGFSFAISCDSDPVSTVDFTTMDEACVTVDPGGNNDVWIESAIGVSATGNSVTFTNGAGCLAQTNQSFDFFVATDAAAMGSLIATPTLPVTAPFFDQDDIEALGFQSEDLGNTCTPVTIDLPTNPSCQVVVFAVLILEKNDELDHDCDGDFTYFNIHRFDIYVMPSDDIAQVVVAQANVCSGQASPVVVNYGHDINADGCLNEEFTAADYPDLARIFPALGGELEENCFSEVEGAAPHNYTCAAVTETFTYNGMTIADQRALFMIPAGMGAGNCYTAINGNTQNYSVNPVAPTYRVVPSAPALTVPTDVCSGDIVSYDIEIVRTEPDVGEVVCATISQVFPATSNTNCLSTVGTFTWTITDAEARGVGYVSPVAEDPADCTMSVPITDCVFGTTGNVLVNVHPDVTAWTVVEAAGDCATPSSVTITSEAGSICHTEEGVQSTCATPSTPLVYSFNPGFGGTCNNVFANTVPNICAQIIRSCDDGMDCTINDMETVIAATPASAAIEVCTACAGTPVTAPTPEITCPVGDLNICDPSGMYNFIIYDSNGATMANGTTDAPIIGGTAAFAISPPLSGILDLTQLIAGVEYTLTLNYQEGTCLGTPVMCTFTAVASGNAAAGLMPMTGNGN